MKIQVQREGIVSQKFAVGKPGADIEVTGGVATKQRAVARGEMVAGVLHRSRERIPMNRLARARFHRRQNRVKIVDLKIPIYRERGKFPAGVARKTRPSMNGKG